MKFEKKSTLIIGGIAGVCVIGAAVTGFALNSGRNNVNPDKNAINVLTQETTANISKNETINSSTSISETTTNISEQSSEELESTFEEVIEETIEEAVDGTDSSENYEEPQTEKTVVEENNNNYYSNNEESENDNNTSEDNDYSEPENNYDDNNYSDNSSDYEEPETEAKTEEVSQRNIVYKADGSIDLANSVFCGDYNDVYLITNSKEFQKLVSDFMKNNPGERIRYDVNGNYDAKSFTVYDLYYHISTANNDAADYSFKFNGTDFVFY